MGQIESAPTAYISLDAFSTLRRLFSSKTYQMKFAVMKAS